MTSATTVPFTSSPMETFARSVLETGLDGAGAMADWLEENGDEYRGRLLRARWRRWKQERAEAPGKHRNMLRRLALANPLFRSLLAEAEVEGYLDATTKLCDEGFERYIRERFVVPFRSLRS